jgi:hypothetical protein
MEKYCSAELPSDVRERPGMPYLRLNSEMRLIGIPFPQKICEKWAKMSPGALDVMNIYDVYARICMPAPPSGRVACRSTVVNTGRTRQVECLITDFRTAGRVALHGMRRRRPTSCRPRRPQSSFFPFHHSYLGDVLWLYLCSLRGLETFCMAIGYFIS